MISVDFEYHQAYSITEAVEKFRRLNDEGKAPLFYNGGTEIITLMRIHASYTKAKAIIDIKAIPECTHIGFKDDYLVIGASIPLAQLEEISEFPLLSKNCSRIADHTSREKITIGGNICGNIKYKETILPLLLTDCDLVIAGESGIVEMPIKQVFDRRIKLNHGSFIVQILVKKQFLEMPFVSKKMTRIDRIGYPLLTVSALRFEDKARFAFSGLCEFPFRSSGVEDALNNKEQSVEERITTAISRLPAPIIDDLEGSASYREFVLRNVLEESIAELEGGKGHEKNGRING